MTRKPNRKLKCYQKTRHETETESLADHQALKLLKNRRNKQFPQIETQYSFLLVAFLPLSISTAESHIREAVPEDNYDDESMNVIITEQAVKLKLGLQFDAHLEPTINESEKTLILPKAKLRKW